MCSCRAEGVRGRVGGGGGEACGGASGAQRGTSAPGRSSRSSRAAESDRGRRGGPAWWSPATMSGLARGRIRRPRGAVPGAPTADLARRVPRAGCVWAGGVLCSVTFRPQTPARRCRSCERSQGSQPHILTASEDPQDWSEKKQASEMRRRRGGRRRGRQRRHPSPYGCPRARLGDQGRGPSRECSAGASFWVHGTAAGPIREPLRTRSLDGLVGGRCSTTKAPDAAAKGPPTAPGLVVGVGCASRGGEAA